MNEKSNKTLIKNRIFIQIEMSVFEFCCINFKLGRILNKNRNIGNTNLPQEPF